MSGDKIINGLQEEIGGDLISRAVGLLAEWEETPNEGDPMIDVLLGVISDALSLLRALPATPEAFPTCRKCAGEMRPGIAIGQTFTAGLPDDLGGDVQTMSAGGPGCVIDCWKCVDCGWSVTDPAAPEAGKVERLKGQVMWLRHQRDYLQELNDRAEARLAEVGAERDRWKKHAMQCDCNGVVDRLEKVEAERDAALAAQGEPVAWDALAEFKSSAEFARKAYAHVCGGIKGRTASVGKHEAKNHEHLRRIYEEAKDAFPRFADTLAWLLWHEILRFDRLAMLVEDHGLRVPTPVSAGVTVKQAAQVLQDLLHMRGNHHEGMTRDDVQSLWDAANDGTGFVAVTAFLSQLILSQPAQD